jgi:hypothetical protein
LILTCLVIRIDLSFRIDSNLKVEFVAFESNNEFYTEIYCSGHSYINVSVLCAFKSQLFLLKGFLVLPQARGTWFAVELVIW